MKTAAYILAGFAICSFGFWLGMKTERENRKHIASRAKTMHPCRTYTTTQGNVNVTWGQNA